MEKSKDYSEIQARKRRQALAKRMREVGPWEIHKANFAKEWGVSASQISKDFKIVLKDIDSEDDVPEAKVHLKGVLRQSIRKLNTYVEDMTTDGKDKAAISRAIGYLTEKYTDILEKYGDKEKVPEETEMVIKWKDEDT